MANSVNSASVRGLFYLSEMFTKNQIVRFAQLQVADSTRLLVMATASAGGGQRRKRAWRKPREAIGPPAAGDGDTSAHKAARTEYHMQSQTEGGVSMSDGSGGQTGPVQSESAQHVPVEPCMSSRDAPIEIDGSVMEGVRTKNGNLVPKLLPCTLYQTESHS